MAREIERVEGCRLFYIAPDDHDAGDEVLIVLAYREDAETLLGMMNSAWRKQLGAAPDIVAAPDGSRWEKFDIPTLLADDELRLQYVFAESDDGACLTLIDALEVVATRVDHD